MSVSSDRYYLNSYFVSFYFYQNYHNKLSVERCCPFRDHRKKKNDWKPYDHFIYFVNYYVKMISFVAIVHKQPVRLAGG
jgi:hypothetical protein